MRVRPLSHYKSPEYPEREIFISHPEMLTGSVPLAWKRKTMVAGALAACVAGSLSNVQCTRSDKTGKAPAMANDKEPGRKAAAQKKTKAKKIPAGVAPVFFHGKGSGAVGCIVMNPPVFLTEDDAYQVIFEEFEKQGIVFDKKDFPVNDIIFDKRAAILNKKGDKAGTRITGTTSLVLDAFSTKHNLGIEYISQMDYEKLGGVVSTSSVHEIDLIEAAHRLKDKLEKHGKINAVIFYDPMVYMKSFSYKECDDEYLAAHPGDRYEELRQAQKYCDSKADQEYKKATEKAKELLRAQVRDFLQL